MRRVRTIDAFVAELTSVEVAGEQVPLWRVADLERHVDRHALLAAPADGAEPPEPPYWAHLRSGAQVLAAAVPPSPGRVVELGCGLGLPGLMAARRGGGVVFVDRVPAALAFVCESAAASAVVPAGLCVADLTTPALAGRFDLVLAAEVLYDRAAFAPLARTIGRHLAPGAARFSPTPRGSTRAPSTGSSRRPASASRRRRTRYARRASPSPCGWSRSAPADGGTAPCRRPARRLESRAVRFAIFDIETRVDKALVRAVLHRHEELSDEEAYRRSREQLVARSASQSDFFPVAFHVPVSIVVADVNDARALTSVQVLGAEGYSEAAIVTGFWERLEQLRGTLVSFNGRAFDLPVLELAALRHGCRIPHYFKGGYRYRYSDEAHYDLYDFLTNCGMYSVRGGFHLLARLVGLPGKGAVDGADVQALWDAGRLEDIHAYCRADVIQTYFLFLRLELMRGRISAEQYAAALAASAPFRAELEA